MPESHLKAGSLEWAKARIKRHISAMMVLAWPAIASRVGIISLSVVDTILVGHFSTMELAYLNLGSSTFIILVLVMSIGLLMGTLVFVADAFGREDYKECGQVWRRSLPFTAFIGVFVALISLKSEAILLTFGQTEELSREGGSVMYILGFGIIGHLFYVNGVFFLEAIGRAKMAIYIMILANIFNVIVSYILVFGEFGMPAMGAEGSAIATTILRILMGLSLVLYLLLTPEFEKYGLRDKVTSKWSDWKEQRKIGYSSSISLGAELSAFSALSIFAGWIGVLELAIFGVIFNIISVPFMLASGTGAATTVRVAISKSRKDAPDTAMAGWTGFGLGCLMIGVASLSFIFFPELIMKVYSQDQALIMASIPILVFSGMVLIFDGGQTVLSNALRGLGLITSPMVIQSFSYLVVMIPVSYWLAIPMGRGLMGLMEGLLYASIVSLLLQGYWFQRTINHFTWKK